jgi:hypothetical protein
VYNVSPSTDHVERGLAKFLGQFRNKPLLSALLRSYLRRVQEVEDATWEVIYNRLLDNAEGVQIDIIGRIVGRGRNNLSDNDYKIAVRAQIRINRSSGRPEDVIDVARLSLPYVFTFSYEEIYPAAIYMQVYGGVDFNVVVLFNNLVKAKAGGVKLWLNTSPEGPENTFTFASGDVTEDDPNRGFGDDAGTVGGVFTDVITT